MGARRRRYLFELATVLDRDERAGLELRCSDGAPMLPARIPDLAPADRAFLEGLSQRHGPTLYAMLRIVREAQRAAALERARGSSPRIPDRMGPYVLESPRAL